MPPGQFAGTQYLPSEEELAALEADLAAQEAVPDPSAAAAVGYGSAAPPPPPPQAAAPPPAYTPSYPASSDASPSGRSFAEAAGVSEQALPVAQPSGEFVPPPPVAADPYAQDYAGAQMPSSYGQGAPTETWSQRAVSGTMSQPSARGAIPPPPASSYNPLAAFGAAKDAVGATIGGLAFTNPEANRNAVGTLVDRIITTPDEAPSDTRRASGTLRIPNPSRGLEERVENLVGGIRDNDPTANRDAVGRLLGLDPNDPTTDIANQISRNAYDWLGDQAGMLASDYGDTLGSMGSFLAAQPTGFKRLILDPVANRGGNIWADTWREAEDVLGPHGMGLRQAQSTLNPVGSGLAANVRDPLAAAKDTFTKEPREWWQTQGPGPWFDQTYQDEAQRIREGQSTTGATNQAEAGARTANDLTDLVQRIPPPPNAQPAIQNLVQNMPVTAEMQAAIQRQRGRMIAQRMDKQPPSVAAPNVAIPDIPSWLGDIAATQRQPVPPTATAHGIPAGVGAGLRQTAIPARIPVRGHERPVGTSAPMPERGAGLGRNVQMIPPFTPPPGDAGQRYAPLPPPPPSLRDRAAGVLQGAAERIPAVSLPSVTRPDVALPTVSLPSVALPNVDVGTINADRVGALLQRPASAPAPTPGANPSIAQPSATAARAPAAAQAGEQIIPRDVGGGALVDIVWQGDTSVAVLDPETGERIPLTDDMTQEQVDAIIADAVARTPATPAASSPTAPSSVGAAAPVAAPATSTRSGGSSGGGGGYASGGYSGGRSRSGSDFDDFFDDFGSERGREFTAEDFLDAADGDRARAASAAKTANRKRRKTGRGPRRSGDYRGTTATGSRSNIPFREPTPLRTAILAALNASMNASRRG